MRQHTGSISRDRLFYGWYIVAAAALLVTYNSFTFVYGFTAFITPIATTFGWGYAQISLAMSFRGLETGTMNPLLGVAADRWPARRLVLIGVSTYGLGILIISRATSLAMFYAGFLIIGFGGSLAISMVPQTTIARWFRRNIGKASGVLAMGFGIGGVMLPLMVKMIDTYGWQNTLIVLALGAWILGIPLSLVFRTRPEEYGLVPDGKVQDDVNAPGSSSSYDFSTGVKEALKMRAFWYISLAFMIQSGTATAAVTQVMPYFTSLGIERSSAGMVAMLVPLVSLGTRLPFGWLADIFNRKYVLAMSLGLISIGLFLFWRIDGSSLGLMIAFAIVFGLGVGGIMPLRSPIIREYFGTKNFGTIFGLISFFTMLGMVIAPPLAGWVYDTLGIFDPIWLIFSGAAMIGVILMLMTPPALRHLRITTSQMAS